jgi:hypothetical protein
MSNELAVSMDELELENAELLPGRETLCAWKCPCGHSGNTTNIFTAVSQNNSATAYSGGGLVSVPIAVNAFTFNFSNIG